MEIIEKIVNYNKYCPTCAYVDLEDYKDPCNDCLNNPVNTNSQKPINYKKAKSKNKMKK